MLTIGGQQVELTEGRLVIRSDSSGRYQWDASGVVQGSVGAPADTSGDPIWVEFETDQGTYRGRGFVEVGAVTDQHTVAPLTIRGTGDLEGLPPSEG